MNFPEIIIISFKLYFIDFCLKIHKNFLENTTITQDVSLRLYVITKILSTRGKQ